MSSIRKRCILNQDNSIWGFIHEQERHMIKRWRDKRQNDFGYSEFFTFSFGVETMKSFVHHISIMVFFHIAVTLLAVFSFQAYDISFDINVALFVSPIVFPLAFSINSDFQRREKVLEDLAAFKSAGVSWFFSMRELKEPAGLDKNWLIAVRNRLISLLFLVGEYLLTANVDKRRTILRGIYDDFAGAHQLTEELRASKLPSNTAMVSRIVHFIHEMGLAVERLRVIRDYRSPRSIRSFNKIFILILLVVLAPYLVHTGAVSGNRWLPYVLASVLSLMFSTLLVVQDRLDDPFDGLGEDDINVETLHEWAPILQDIKVDDCGTKSEESNESNEKRIEAIDKKAVEEEKIDKTTHGNDTTHPPVEDRIDVETTNHYDVDTDYTVYYSPDSPPYSTDGLKGLTKKVNATEQMRMTPNRRSLKGVDDEDCQASHRYFVYNQWSFDEGEDKTAGEPCRTEDVEIIKVIEDNPK